jgi:hypothetical protein
MAQQYKVGTHCTTVSHNPLRVTYHSTVIVEAVPGKGFRLNSGGYRTSTTKTRMNQASNEYGLGFSVFQKAGKWYVDLPFSDGKGKTVPFVDGMVIGPRSLPHLGEGSALGCISWIV